MTDASRVHLFHDAVGTGTPVTVAALTVLGIGLQDWVYILTILIALMQIARYVYFGVNWWQKRKAAPKVVPTVPPPA